MMPLRKTNMVSFLGLSTPFYIHRIDLFVQDLTVKHSNANSVRHHRITWEWTANSTNPEL